MRLTRVTITGADDLVDPEALLELSLEFPFAEWGILRGGEDRNGTPRYPIPAWVAAWRDAIEDIEPKPAWALHLCGAPARHAIAGSPTMFSALNQFSVRPRVQLNGFGKYRIPMLMLAQLMPETEFILQCQSEGAIDHAAELANLHPNISALWDISGGRGVLDFDSLTMLGGPSWMKLGRAGGIAPDNVVSVLEALQDFDEELWIDLESGARTDDRFDLAKVRRVLELAKPFVEAA